MNAIIDKIDAKKYLMVAGVIAPAAVLYTVTSLVIDKSMTVNKYAAFAGIAGMIIGGFVSARLIENKVTFNTKLGETPPTDKEIKL